MGWLGQSAPRPPGDDSPLQPRYRRAMIGTHRVEGYVIVSADGMIADARGQMPDVIRNDADQKFFQGSLDRAAVLVHGRHSHEGGPRAASRKRLVLSRKVTATAKHPSLANALLWNPAGASLEQAITELGANEGPIAIIGGTDVFSMFLPFYDSFYLSHAERARIPGGRPVFSEVGSGTTPQDVLARHGLKPVEHRDLDAAAGVTLTRWDRPPG